MSVCRNWLRRALTVGSFGAALAVMPAAAIAAEAVMHPEGTLKLADRKLVAGSTVEIGGEMFAGGGRLELVLVSVAGRFRVGDVTADAAGEFSQPFEIPADLDVGAYRLVAIATDEDEVASLNVELLAAAVEADKENGHAEGDSHAEEGEHSEDPEPTDEPLALDRAGSPWVTGGAVVAILFAVVAGGLLLRRPRETA